MRRGLAVAFALLVPVVPACASLVGLDDPAELSGAVLADADSDATAAPLDATSASDGATTDTKVPDAAGDAGACDDPDLLAYWRFDEGTGTKAADCSKYMHTGTLTGDSTTWVAGRKDAGSALSFVFEDYVDFGNPTGLRVTGALSVSAWVFVRSYANAGRIISKSSGDGDRGWELNFEGDGRLRFRVAVDTTNQVNADLVLFSALNVWTHVAGVYTPGADVKLYVDGTQVAIATGAPAMQRDSTTNVLVGRRPGCCSFDGNIDDVRVYKRALSASEVKAIAAP